MSPIKKKKRPLKGVSRAVRKKIKLKSAASGRTVGPAAHVEPPKTQGTGYFLVVALILTAAGIYSLPNFHLLLSKGSFLAQVLVHPSLLLIGFICLVLAFYQVPDDTKPSEMPKWRAYPLFAFFFSLCFFWRFYHPLEPSAPFWFDNLVVTGDIRAI